MQDQKVTQAELAQRARVSQGAISRYLNRKAAPKAEELYRISMALGVTMEWLLTGEGARERIEVTLGEIRKAKELAKELTEGVPEVVQEKVREVVFDALLSWERERFSPMEARALAAEVLVGEVRDDLENLRDISATALEKLKKRTK